ncbi:hypothetical protein MHYP_G00020260 [Metynnis hypsauchen]
MHGKQWERRVSDASETGLRRTDGGKTLNMSQPRLPGCQIKTSEDTMSSPRHLFTSPGTLQRHDRVVLIAKWHKHHEYECGPTAEKPRSVIATITGMC